MPQSLTPWRRVVVIGAIVLATTACTPDRSASDDAATNPAVPSGTVAIPESRLTPFCQAMIDLSDRLETDPPDDVDALIIETYTDIEDEVPAEILPDFQAVLADLEGEPVPSIDPVVTPPSTGPADGSGGSIAPGSDSFYEEGYTPRDDPAGRLNGYIDFACRDNQNNPGPPATQPLDQLVVATTEG
jgi:hypothetical protein